MDICEVSCGAEPFSYLQIADAEREERYMEQLKHSKIKGYLFQQQNYMPES